MKNVELSPDDTMMPGNDIIDTKSRSKTHSYGMIAFAVFNFLGFVGIILSYFLFDHFADQALQDATKICNSNAAQIDLMEDVPLQLVESWAYNLTNPLEYLNGGDARVHEMGVYGWNFQPVLENIEVGKETMEFDLYNHDVRFNSDASCDTCNPADKFYSQFTPYTSIMGATTSEAVALLIMSCTTTQIGLINSPNPAVPYCGEDEMKEPVTCRCCALTPTANATTCTDIASKSSRSGGILSWISKYDGGIQLSDTPSPNFRLSTGDYTALVRETNVKEISLGAPSTLMGFFGTNRAILGGDLESIQEIAKVTNDMKDACSPLNFCPVMLQLLQRVKKNPANAEEILKAIDCSGIIPSADELENTYGLDHDRALELRYLEGVNCRPYGLTLAISTTIQLQVLAGAGASYTCADASHSLPCCMTTFAAPALGLDGSGVGCLGWANGIIQSRNLFSVEEAQKYITPAPHAKSFTACAEKSLRYRQEMWHGRDGWIGWFTPDSYVYPNMNWADPAIVTGATAGTVNGTFTPYDIEGTQMAIRKGRGVTTGFLDYDLSDGEPISRTENVWAPFRISSLEFRLKETVKYLDLKCAYMTPYIQTEFTAAEHEARQRQGEMPYPNQKNVAYSKGLPVVVGYPNFYKVNEAILSQSSNAARFAPDGSEIQLYRTRDGYNADSILLDTPVRMDTDTLETFGAEYEGDIMIEPASGFTLDARVVTMVSNYVWQCDPRLDSNCQLMASAYNVSNPQCYNFGTGTQLPCSVTNVFTPMVHGGKVMPLLWVRSLAVPSEDLVDILLGVSDTRYALSIAVITLPIIFFVGLIYSAWQIKCFYFSGGGDGSIRGMSKQLSL